MARNSWSSCCKSDVGCNESEGGSSVASVMGSNIYGVPICKCEKKSVIYISKTEKNPNRAFYGCRFYK
ncbi:hypothetical protein OROMI_000697 [Orobanche minor]